MLHMMMGVPPAPMDPGVAQNLCRRLQVFEVSHNNVSLEWVESLADALDAEIAATGEVALQQLNLNGTPELEVARWPEVRERLLRRDVAVLHERTLYSNRVPRVRH